MDEISAVDRDALQRSLIACRAESRARSRQIDAKLRHEPWERVAQFASYSAQIESLGLESVPRSSRLRAAPQSGQALRRSARRARKRRDPKKVIGAWSQPVRTASAARDDSRLMTLPREVVVRRRALAVGRGPADDIAGRVDVMQIAT